MITHFINARSLSEGVDMICCIVPAIRKELVRRSKEVSEEWKERMLTAEGNLEEVKDTHRAVSAGN